MGMAKVTEDQVYQIYDMYDQFRSMPKVAEAMGLAYETVRKYINKGDTKRGIPSYRKYKSKIHAKMEKELIRSEANDRAWTVNKLRQMTSIMIEKILDDLNSGDYTPSIQEIDKLKRLEQLLVGNPDHRDGQSIESEGDRQEIKKKILERIEGINNYDS